SRPDIESIPIKPKNPKCAAGCQRLLKVDRIQPCQARASPTPGADEERTAASCREAVTARTGNRPQSRPGRSYALPFGGCQPLCDAQQGRRRQLGQRSRLVIAKKHKRGSGKKLLKIGLYCFV